MNRLIIKKRDRSKNGRPKNNRKAIKEADKHFGKNNILGLYFQEVSLTEQLESPKIKELARRARKDKDEDACGELAGHFLRLVIKIANKYRKMGVPIPYLDLIQEGNVGLMEAAKRFDERKDVKFSTFAIWWIRAAIRKAIPDAGSKMRLPGNKWTVLFKVMDVSNRFLDKFGYEPTPEQIVRIAQLKIHEVEIVLQYMRMKITHLEDNISCEDGNRPLAEIVADAKPNPEQYLEACSLEKDIIKALKDLTRFKRITEKEAKIFSMRLGIDGYPKDKTLGEIGNYFSLSRERIRQLIEKIKPKVAAILIERRVVAANGISQPPT